MSALAGIILAAGTSSRFGVANKLLANWHGQPMARTVAEAALATELDPVIVVTGHQADEVAAALAGLDAETGAPVVEELNVAFGSGFSTGEGTTVSGGATVGGRIFDERLTSTITTRDVNVRLPEQTAGTLQSLTPHRDVLVVGSEREGDSGGAGEGYHWPSVWLVRQTRHSVQAAAPRAIEKTRTSATSRASRSARSLFLPKARLFAMNCSRPRK